LTCSGYDDIIQQHKAACLRVTSLLACKDLLWIGTSAGVILTMPLPHIAPATTKLANAPSATGNLQYLLLTKGPVNLLVDAFRRQLGCSGYG
jgi:hypothetical protein